MKFWLVLISTLLFPAMVLAQTPEEEARRHGVTFPITSLGNCASYSDCRTYCEDPAHQDTCIAFAKRKGFYQQSNTPSVLERARFELGCDSENSCRAYCELSANHDRCSTFAQQHGLAGGQTQDPSKGEILEKAKQSLGCTSYESCRSFCEQPVNADRCSQFARQEDLAGGHHSAGPGGCTSETTCRQFCDQPQNYQICSSYSQSHGADEFSGPGGCKSESECRAYCQTHSAECGGSAPQDYDPIQMCNRTPNCSWTGTTCQCSPTSTTYPSSYPAYTPSTYYSPYPAYTPSSYTPLPGSDPATECVKYPGCSWTSSGCQCPAMNTSYTPTSYSQPTPVSQLTSQPVESSAPTPYSQPDPASECTKYPGCSWTGNSCNCPPVQGASTSTPGVFPGLWQCLFGR